MPARPLSPHLTIYRFAYTMVLSITHRITGVFLSLGLLALLWWLAAAATGPDAYVEVVNFFSFWLFKALLLAWLAALLYHLANGIRHLLWDAIIGIERQGARRGAIIVLVMVAIAFVGCLLWIFGRAGPTP